MTRLNLASAALGAVALSATDEFFGSRDRLLQDAAPVFIPGKYDDNGKWMDGWESRRKRGPGHDACVIRLATRGILVAFDIDTTHFTGNYPHAASIDCVDLDRDPDGTTAWRVTVPPTALAGNGSNHVELDTPVMATHLRLNIFPDGGVARLRALGTPIGTPELLAGGLIDLAAALIGTRVIACNDAHFGRPEHLLLPGIGARMEDGWETRRRREPGNDWVILALGRPGVVSKIGIDTSCFKGNFPESGSIQAAFLPDLPDQPVIPASLFWPELMPRTGLTANSAHWFSDPVLSIGPVTHVRFNIYPDGGVNRLRLLGRLTEPAE